MLGAKICGAELGTRRRSRRHVFWRRGVRHVNATLDALLCTARHLGAKICGAETCYLDAISPDTDAYSTKMSLRLSRD